jgi:SWI/SNF-related matrix-associated actin-dependent regulator of chromatin subfamily A-like protein 1
MGIGKTRTFIEAVKQRGAKRVLALVPATALLVWKREIYLWHPGATFVVVRTGSDLLRPATYYLVSHGLMSQKDGNVVETLAIRAAPFEMCAIDEAHAFNASASNRVIALRRVAAKLGKIVPMSGTPIRNHAGDLYTLLSICWPEGLKLPGRATMSRYDYEERFCKVAHKSFGGGSMVRVIEGSKNLDALKTMIAPYMVRVRKEEVFKDLPPILWDTVPVPLDPAHMTQEDLSRLEGIVVGALQDGGAGGTVDDMVSALQRASSGANLMALRRLLGIAKLRGAIDYIVDMLENLPDNRKVLVFAHHAHVINAMFRHLGEYSPAVLVGDSKPRDREEAVTRFLTDDKCRVFIGNIQAAGTAITLVGPKCKCSDVVFVESSWTPMDNAQAACRVHRIGQQDGVVARMLSAAGTVDDLINGLLVRKARDFTQLFDAQQVEGEKK